MYLYVSNCDLVPQKKMLLYVSNCNLLPEKYHVKISNQFHCFHPPFYSFKFKTLSYFYVNRFFKKSQKFFRINDKHPL